MRSFCFIGRADGIPGSGCGWDMNGSEENLPISTSCCAVARQGSLLTRRR